MAPKKTPICDVVIKALISQGVADALSDYEANKGNGNGHDSYCSGSGSGRMPNTSRVCTYKDFLNCQPLNFKGTEGFIGLNQWFKKMEFIFHISNCTVECQIKYATCTMLGSVLMCYKQRFQELALMCGRMFPEESDQVEKHVGGLPDMIQGSVMASKLKTMQEAIEFANDLMDQKIRTFTERQAENKRKLDNNPRDNQAQQQPFKRQNVAKAYTAWPGEKKAYGRTLPLIPAAANTQRAPEAVQRVVTCYECGIQGHYKKDCPKLKNKNRGNHFGNGEAHARAYALRGNKPNPDSNIVTGTFLLNNRYASIFFLGKGLPR
ncbi:putative reverse transcriptase domain-containing protein [Tanacetum coccineum]